MQLKTKSLEHQILEVKLKQLEEINKQGEANLQTYTEQIAQLLQTEQDLRGRLALYGEKFEQFQVWSSKHSQTCSLEVEVIIFIRSAAIFVAMSLLLMAFKTQSWTLVSVRMILTGLLVLNLVPNRQRDYVDIYILTPVV